MNKQLTVDQMAFDRIARETMASDPHLLRPCSYAPRPSLFHRAVHAFANVVLALLTIAVIVVITIWTWESFRPRVVVLVAPPPAPAQKSCGVPV